MYQGPVETKKKESLSIIDLGYNSIKISIYDIYKNGHYKKRFQRQEYVQIGHELKKNNNNISEQSIDRTSKALESFKRDLKDGDVDSVIPIATSAVRDSINQKFVIDELKKQTGLLFNVLSGPEEGFFSYLGAQSYVRISDGIFFDLGGGSLELMHIVDFKIVKTLCLDLGVLRLSENNIVYCDSSKDPNGDSPRIDYEKLEAFLRKNLPSPSHVGFSDPGELKLVSIGGTVRSLYKFVSKMFDLPISYSHHNMFLDKRMMNLASNFLRQLSFDELAKLKLIDNQRTKTITTGSLVVNMLMEKMKFNSILVCPTGLREGVLEHYLYFKLDKQYRKRKKFIEINSEPLFVIESNEKKGNEFKKDEIKNRQTSLNQSNILNHAVLPESNTFAFPRKLSSVKINKLI